MTTFGMIGGEGGWCWGLQYYDYMRENIGTYYNFGNYKHRDLHSYAVEGLEIIYIYIYKKTYLRDPYPVSAKHVGRAVYVWDPAVRE